jgi:tetratricopeptide (TPR) repeat protein
MSEQQGISANIPPEVGAAGPLAVARFLIGENQPAEAVPMLKDLVKREPDNAEAHQELAVALFKTIRYGPAVKAAQQALELDPSLSRPHGILAWVAMNKGRYDQAESELQAQLEALPADDLGHRASVYNQMSFLYFRQKRYEEAEKALGEAVALVPDRPIPRLNLALLHMRIKAWDQARSELEQILAMPDLLQEVAYTARLNLGHAYAHLGRYDDAREHFAQAAAVRRTILTTLYSALPLLARVPPVLLWGAIIVITLILLNLFRR